MAPIKWIVDLVNKNPWFQDNNERQNPVSRTAAQHPVVACL